MGIILTEWTPKQTELLIETLLDKTKNHSYEDIGRIFGISRNAVAGKVSRLKGKGFLNLTKEEREKLPYSDKNLKKEEPPSSLKHVIKVKNTTPRKMVLPLQRAIHQTMEKIMVEEEQITSGCLLVDATRFQCRYPLNQKVSATMRVCGDSVIKDTSWCLEHSKIVWQPRTFKKGGSRFKGGLLSRC